MAAVIPVREGFYRIELNNTFWEVPIRYQSLSLIGSGSFGQVCSAEDMVSKEKVAIKKLSRPFQSVIHARRAYRELKLLREISHDNVITLHNVFTPAKTLENFQDVYLVTTLMGADLSKILKTQTLSGEHVQFFTYQMLRALKYIHSARIIHRDIKPSNIAVNENCDMKLLDFGLARQTDDQMSGYVTTRWYRAPEIMLNWMHYNETVDIWSVGCIMAEMLTRRPLFPADTHLEHLEKILDVVGTPNDELLNKICSEEAKRYIRHLPKRERKDFKDVFRGASADAIDLLEKMLDLDPEKRITAQQALGHPYLADFSDPSDEPSASQLEQSCEEMNISIEGWKELVFREVISFEPKTV